MGYSVVHEAYVCCDCRTCNDDTPEITNRNKIKIPMRNVLVSSEIGYIENKLRDKGWLVIGNNGDNVYFCSDCRIKLINDSIEGRADY